MTTSTAVRRQTGSELEKRLPSLLAHVPVYALIFTQGSVWTAFFALTPSYRDELDLSRLELGIVSTSFGVATVLTAVPIGILTDRVGARATMIVAGVFLTVAALGHAFAVGFWTLLLSRSGYAATIVLIWAAATNWLRERVGPDARSAALAAMWPILGIGTLVGPLFAASLVDRYGFRLPFLTIAAAAAGITLVFVVTTDSSPRERIHEQRTQGMLRALRTEPLLAGAVVIMFIGPVAETVLSIIGPIQLDENGESSLFIGAAFAAASGAFVLVGVLVTRVARHAVRMSVAAFFLGLLAAPFLVLLVTDTTAVVVGALVLRMALLGVLYTISFALGVLGAERAGLGGGTVAGLLMLASGVANIVGPLMGGALAQATGDRSAYAAVALGCCACAAWLSVRRDPRELHRVPRTP